MAAFDKLVEKFSKKAERASQRSKGVAGGVAAKRRLRSQYLADFARRLRAAGISHRDEDGFRKE